MSALFKITKSGRRWAFSLLKNNESSANRSIAKYVYMANEGKNKMRRDSSDRMQRISKKSRERQETQRVQEHLLFLLSNSRRQKRQQRPLCRLNLRKLVFQKHSDFSMHSGKYISAYSLVSVRELYIYSAILGNLGLSTGS